jgi:amino acid transporter
MVFYALVILLTLIAYAAYRYLRPEKPPHHKYFILAANTACLLIALVDIPSDAAGDAGGDLANFLRMAHVAVMLFVSAVCFAAYKVIHMAPDKQQVPIAWVIGLYLVVYIGMNAWHFYRDAAEVRCDDPAAAAKTHQDMKVHEVVEASIMYQRVCNKGEGDLRARIARMIHNAAEKK